MAKYYASLIGPLNSIYYPLPPAESEIELRLMLNSSRLKHLWCSILSEKEVDDWIDKAGGIKLSDRQSRYLDYDSFAVAKGMGRIKDGPITGCFE